MKNILFYTLHIVFKLCPLFRGVIWTRLFVFLHYPPFLLRPDEDEHYDNIAEPARGFAEIGDGEQVRPRLVAQQDRQTLPPVGHLRREGKQHPNRDE